MTVGCMSGRDEAGKSLEMFDPKWNTVKEMNSPRDFRQRQITTAGRKFAA